MLEIVINKKYEDTLLWTDNWQRKHYNTAKMLLMKKEEFNENFKKISKTIRINCG